MGDRIPDQVGNDGEVFGNDVDQAGNDVFLLRRWPIGSAMTVKCSGMRTVRSAMTVSAQEMADRVGHDGDVLWNDVRLVWDDNCQVGNESCDVHSVKLRKMWRDSG